ncbi:lysophospholipid acyltransferase family protein [Ginsengibacter hankyongi]|uniref:lysophospholipid acyltransferase family protein n=1 Tax=Ginsengibacter hankyongi TaxID=2607284 RepID=UPI001F32FAA3|nr:lysophospholipid acyltransferase family protein [Ginsengibacter hankyongi]
MSSLSRIFRLIFSIYGFLIFLVLMFLLLPLFIYSFLLNEIKGGNVLYKISRFWADAFFFATGITYKNIYEEKHDTNKQYIFVSNHISYLDIPMMMKAIRRQHVRILGKAEMTKVPIFGTIYKKGAVLVDRENPGKRSQSIKSLIYFLHKKISVFICPEGTFNMTHKPLKNFYDGAFKIAIQTQMPIKPILFLDTYDRLNYKSIFSLNPGKCRSVYLSETSTSGLTINDVPMLKEKIFRQMEDGLKRYNASWIK